MLTISITSNRSGLITGTAKHQKRPMLKPSLVSTALTCHVAQEKCQATLLFRIARLVMVLVILMIRENNTGNPRIGTLLVQGLRRLLIQCQSLLSRSRELTVAPTNIPLSTTTAKVLSTIQIVPGSKVDTLRRNKCPFIVNRSKITRCAKQNIIVVYITYL